MGTFKYTFKIMITKIKNFKLILENQNSDVQVYTPNKFYEYITRDGDMDPRFVKKMDGGKKVFKYYTYSDYNGSDVFENNTLFFGIFENDIMVGLTRVYLARKNKAKNIWLLSYLCIDPAYTNKGYASKLSHFIFKYFKDNFMTFETSSYTEEGFVKLKPLFNKLSKLYNVEFIDKGKF